MILTKEVLPSRAAPPDIGQCDRSLTAYEQLLWAGIFFIAGAYGLVQLLERAWAA